MTATDVYPTHYAYPLVTWRATLLGAAVALVTSLMLNLLGVSLGVAALAFAPTTGVAASTGIIGVVWVVISNLIALGFGAWMAGRTTANPDHHGGALQGLAVWAVTSLVILFLAGQSLTGMAMQSADLANASATRSAAPRSAPTPNAQDLQGAANQAGADIEDNAADIQNAATKAAAVTAAASFSLFLAMVLGLIAAVVGARIGARHPSWSDRPRFTIVERKHTT
ncbi:MAG: hypothetical protein ACYDD1_04845 [Caulobacteraceae bacterium]